ncbi:MAG: hypothetical protein NTX11_03125 [Candidatus Saccharibacteria bacterium]|nr:hypothetical protein [Candidatus Saccharibacteria bacterium]
MKEIIGIIAVVLTFVGYIPYIIDTIKGKTTPHIYTWFIWGLVTAIAFALQLSDKAGPGAFTTLAAAIVCFIIFGLGVRQGKQDITKSDTVFFVMSLFALALWLFAKQPVLSVILVSLIDMLGFIPTIRKSWHRPNEETLSSYITNTLRFTLALFALQRYTLITTLYPISWVIANGLFSVFLSVRRKKTSTSGWQG